MGLFPFYDNDVFILPDLPHIGNPFLVRGRSVVYQQVNPDIIEGFKRILRYDYDGLIVAVPKIFDDLSLYRKTTMSLSFQICLISAIHFPHWLLSSIG